MFGFLRTILYNKNEKLKKYDLVAHCAFACLVPDLQEPHANDQLAY